MKITRFKDIPQLTRAETYNTNIPLTHILKTLSEWEEDEYYHLQLKRLTGTIKKPVSVQRNIDRNSGWLK